MLEVLDRTYFGKDRLRQIKGKIDEIVALLDTNPVEFVQNKREKADLLFLRGKALDYFPEYSKSAEEFLSKAIKLLPGKHEAWDALGHTYWKKRDLSAAKKCFEGSLEQNQQNKDALRHLSMVLRMIEEHNADLKKKNYKESIAWANKAVSLDLGDAQSWYVLGNAHLTNFFVNDENITELTTALKAYAQTERLQKEPNPDLYYNRATILEYLERYNEAVRDYSKAHQIDPNLQADKKAEKIVDFVIHAATLIATKGKIKS